MRRQKRRSDDLPGRPNATIRSPAALTALPRVRVRHGPIATSTRCWPVCLSMTSETAAPRPKGRGAEVFAPFVYRLGRHPFTVERAVRFR